jgi:cobalt-zinc-cadmium efflux system protein
MKKGRIIAVIVLNLVIVVSEVIFGLKAGSVGLIADAMHNLSDVIAMVIALIAIVYSEKKATPQMTFGYVRAEMMAGFINSIFLVGAMFYIIYESVMKFIHPEDVSGVIMMSVAGVALLANAVSVFILRGAGVGHSHKHDHGKEHHHNEDLNIKTAILHLVSDAAISFSVVIGGLVIHLLGFNYIDPILSIIFAGLIIFRAFSILKSTFFSLMDRHEHDIELIVAAIRSFGEVKNIHSVRYITPSSKDIYLFAHIVLDKNLRLCEVEEILEKIRKTLVEKHGITQITLQPETGKYSDDDILCDTH